MVKKKKKTTKANAASKTADKAKVNKTEEKKVEEKRTVKHTSKTSDSSSASDISIWQIATAILAVLLLVSIFTGGSGNDDALNTSLSSTDDASANLKEPAQVVLTNENVLSKEKAAQVALDYIGEYLLPEEVTVNLEEVKDIGTAYLMKIEMEGQSMDTYVTKDGNMFFMQPVFLNVTPEVFAPEEEPVVEVTKTEKPVVELFVMSHCPYGTQAEKGMLPVVNELGDKIDFELKFVNYAMHPSAGEVQEELNEYCIQRDYNDKFVAYLSAFLEDGDGEAALKAVGLTFEDIATCVEETDKEFDVTKNLEDKDSWLSGSFPKFMIYDADNQKYNVRGSPTLVINGAQVQAGRDAQSILDAVCEGFVEKPEECNTDMSEFGNPAPGFGFDTQGGSATTAGCGA